MDSFLSDKLITLDSNEEIPFDTNSQWYTHIRVRLYT